MNRSSISLLRPAVFLALGLGSVLSQASVQTPGLVVRVDDKDGSYSLGSEGLALPVLRSGVAVKIKGQWLPSNAYPQHRLRKVAVRTQLGDALSSEVVFSGLNWAPDLSYRLLSYPNRPYAEIQVTVHNTSQAALHVEAIRVLQAEGANALRLGASDARDRVLSDSFSEDTPPMAVRDLRDAPDGRHLGVGSQLIFNRDSGWSFFAGALSSDRFLTLLKLSIAATVQGAYVASYDIESTGTTEINAGMSLAESPQEDKIPLDLTVPPGGELSSERVLLSVDRDDHRQLETYGELVRRVQHARVAAPPVLGWWSWTAYYYGLSEQAAITNAKWLAQNLAPFGFRLFHVDEGYQYARGEYTTPDAALFPHGMVKLEDEVRSLGLVPGLWTAPFEVSERSEVYLQHPQWLVHNAAGRPIPLGWANDHHDRIYVLDTTHPEAQQYLRNTYATLTRNWGVRYLKLDFMDATAVEGFRYRANTTALEAQRIGLDLIRQTVGDDVLLDKDGGPMLSAVGFVDYGRTGQDTGHTFSATQQAATSVIARYYMNRNFFVNDPDAFTVSTQTVKDHAWHGGKVPLTLDEAKVSIMLSAVAGSMFEIGDDLPLLGSEPQRLALVKNPDLLDMVNAGRASVPIDLMTFDPADEQPSVLVLHETPRQSIVTVFNWTGHPRSHTLSLESLGLSGRTYQAVEVFGADKAQRIADKVLRVELPPHSVRVYRFVDPSVPATLGVRLDGPAAARSGDSLAFAATDASDTDKGLRFLWDFGDGTSDAGATVRHAFTHAGRYRVKVTSTGVGGETATSSLAVDIQGDIPSAFVPEAKRRLTRQ